MPVRGPVTVGDHVIPEGTECLCVYKHVPGYAHVFPYTLPDGYVIYLCPNQYHSTKTLVNMYHKLDGVPHAAFLTRFSVVAQRLARLHFRVEKEGVTTEQILAVEKLNRLRKSD